MVLTTKQELHLSQADIEQAIREFVRKREQNIPDKSIITFNYCMGRGVECTIELTSVQMDNL